MTTIYIRQDTVLPKLHANEKYVTEKTLIHTALNKYAPLRAHSILDIGAGDGRWGAIAQDLTMAEQLVGVELDDEPMPLGYTHWYSGQDFLTWDPGLTFDLIVSNPPFSLAEKMIRHAWPMLRNVGTMIMLLPLAFQATMGRYEGLWTEIYPEKVAVCSRRPSFYGGGTNGTDHGIYIWKKDKSGFPVGMKRTWTVELLPYERDRENR